jgi:hypothetical protein
MKNLRERALTRGRRGRHFDIVTPIVTAVTIATIRTTLSFHHRLSPNGQSAITGSSKKSSTMPILRAH